MTKQLENARRNGIRVFDRKINGGRLIRLSNERGIVHVYFKPTDTLDTLKWKVERLLESIKLFYI